MAVGDFTGNGRLDLAVSDATTSNTGPIGYTGPFASFSVLLNNGDGTLAAPITHPFFLDGSGEFTAVSLAAGDFTGKGRDDLVIGTGNINGSNYLEVLLSNGDGTFTKAGFYAVSGDGSGGLVVGDFNHDGKRDFAVASVSGQVSVFLGNGDGTFQAGVPYSVADVAGGHSLAAVDMNHDGNPDLVVQGTQSVSVLLGNGDGTFQSPITTPLGAPLSGLAVADFTSDGKPDVAVGANGGVLVLPGNGDGTFGQPISNATGTVTVCGAADFNGSGHEDLIVRNLYTIALNNGGFAPGGIAARLPGNGDGTFATSNYLDTITASGGGSSPGFYPLDVVAGDFDGNGSPDLAVYFSFFTIEGTVAIALNQASGSPAISSLGTTSTPEGSSNLTLTVNGSNFVSGSSVDWNGISLATTYVSGTQLQATIPAADLADETTATITVANPGTAGTSNGETFTVAAIPPTASLSGPASAILNQSLTFTLGAASPSPTDQAAGFSYTIDWGDGTTQNPDVQVVPASANNGSGLAVPHTYAAPGTYTVHLTAADDSGAVSSSVSQVVNVSYNFGGFLPPLKQNLAFASGRSIPIKFQLTDANGNYITTLSAVTALAVTYPDGSTHSLGGLSYDPTANQYAAKWSTKGLGIGSYAISLSLLDGTTHTLAVQIKTTHGSSGLTTDAAGGTGSLTGALLAGDMELYVDNSNGLLTSDELARIADAVAAVDAVIVPYGVAITEVADSGAANVVLDMGSSSAVGGYADGVLGCYDDAGTITLIQGWNWYTGIDSSQIATDQYDFQTVVTHELGHALGLGHSTDPASLMNGTLDTGVAKRALASADLNIPDPADGADGLHADLRGASALPVAPGAALERALAAVTESSGDSGPTSVGTVPGVVTGLDLALADRFLLTGAATPRILCEPKTDSRISLHGCRITLLDRTAFTPSNVEFWVTVPVPGAQQVVFRSGGQQGAVGRDETPVSASRAAPLNVLMREWDSTEATRLPYFDSLQLHGLEHAVSRRPEFAGPSLSCEHRDNLVTDLLFASLFVAGLMTSPSERSDRQTWCMQFEPGGIKGSELLRSKTI
jgi:hypothetical protein